jgi:hypothetical protein
MFFFLCPLIGCQRRFTALGSQNGTTFRIYMELCSVFASGDFEK